MPVGLEILNTSGSIVINQDYKALQMVSKVASSSFTMTTSGSGIYQRRIYTYSFPYTDALYAVSQQSGSTTPVIMSAGNPGATTTTVTVSCAASATAPVFDVFVFRPGGGGTTSSGVGFEVYNADGSLGFGSTYKPLKVLSQFDWRYDTADISAPSFFDASDYAATFTGKRVACLFSRHARALDGDGTLLTRTTPVYSAHFVNNQSTGDAMLSWLITGNNGKDLPYWERPGRYMFIDVTNY